MLLDLTIAQLDRGPVLPERAQEMAELGYPQWPWALPAMSDYRREATRAHGAAAPVVRRSPAVFCDLLVASAEAPTVPPSITAVVRRRRPGPAHGVVAP